MSEAKVRLLDASSELQRLSDEVAAIALQPPTKEYPTLTPVERSDLASKLGQIAGIGIGIGWIAKYEL